MREDLERKDSDSSRHSISHLQAASSSSVEYHISDPYVTLRHNVATINDAELVTRLVVEAHHPKVSGHVRCFDVTQPFMAILEANAPEFKSTVAQVVNPSLSLSARLDALKTALLHFSTTPVHEIPGSPTTKDIRRNGTPEHELEPTTTIETELLTDLSDALEGRTVRAINVLRNDSLFVQFQICENSEKLHSASIIAPFNDTSLEWPLIDQDGHGATNETVDQIVHDYTFVLLRLKGASRTTALLALAQELKERVGRNDDLSHPLRTCNFKREVLLVSNDASLIFGEIPRPEISNALAPNDIPYLPRSLPDSRIVWLGHTASASGIEQLIRIVGYSLEGNRFDITASLGTTGPSVARGAYHQALLHSVGGWPDFRGMIRAIERTSGADVDFTISSSPDEYPLAVNELIAKLSPMAEICPLDRGIASTPNLAQDTHLEHYLRELVRGRSPFHFRNREINPAYAWTLQAFLDGNLNGSVYATNGLGSKFVISFDGRNHSLEQRQREFLILVQFVATSPNLLAYSELFSPILEQTRENLPDSSMTDIEAYGVANRTAQECWLTLRELGLISLMTTSEKPNWKIQRLASALYRLTLLSAHSVDRPLPYLLAFDVTSRGITQLAISRGDRGPLGGLKGTVVKAKDRHNPLQIEDMKLIVRAACRSQSFGHSVSQMQEDGLLQKNIHFHPVTTLRHVDQEATAKDFRSWLWSFLPRR